MHADRNHGGTGHDHAVTGTLWGRPVTAVEQDAGAEAGGNQCQAG
ncbi:MAG: hypothetical protein ACYDHM_09770 [Acidiferrobacterales bacterium]